MRLADFRDDRLRRRAGIRRLGARAASNKVVGAVAEGVGGVGDALLAADCAACGPYARGDKEKLGADGLTRQDRLLGARHQSVDAELKRLLGSPTHGLDHAEAVDRVEKIGVVVRGQDPCAEELLWRA